MNTRFIDECDVILLRYAHSSACAHVYTEVNTRTLVHAYTTITQMHSQIYAFMQVHVYICIWIYIYIYIYIYIKRERERKRDRYAYIYIKTKLCVCVCVCVCVYIYTLSVLQKLVHINFGFIISAILFKTDINGHRQSKWTQVL